MLCANGLHVLSDDGWRSSNGARCRSCLAATKARYDVSEKGRERSARYYEARGRHVQSILRASRTITKYEEELRELGVDPDSLPAVMA